MTLLIVVISSSSSPCPCPRPCHLIIIVIIFSSSYIRHHHLVLIIIILSSSSSSSHPHLILILSLSLFLIIIVSSSHHHCHHCHHLIISSSSSSSHPHCHHLIVIVSSSSSCHCHIRNDSSRSACGDIIAQGERLSMRQMLYQKNWMVTSQACKHCCNSVSVMRRASMLHCFSESCVMCIMCGVRRCSERIQVMVRSCASENYQSLSEEHRKLPGIIGGVEKFGWLRAKTW